MTASSSAAQRSAYSIADGSRCLLDNISDNKINIIIIIIINKININFKLNLMIKLKTSQSQVVLNKLINKNILKHPVYLAPDGLIINKDDLDETLKVFEQLDLKAK